MNATAVCFSPKPAVVHDHLCRTDYSKTERKLSWYSRKELSAIQKETQKTITWIMGGMHGGEDRFCSMGLESRTPAKSRDLKIRRQQAIQAVLNAQTFAKAQGKREFTHPNQNPELVTKASAAYSAPRLEETNVMSSSE